MFFGMRVFCSLVFLASGDEAQTGSAGSLTMNLPGRDRRKAPQICGVNRSEWCTRARESDESALYGMRPV